MNLSEIEELAKEGEPEVLEFKTSTANIKSAFETVCAFLNSQGGDLARFYRTKTT